MEVWLFTYLHDLVGNTQDFGVRDQAALSWRHNVKGTLYKKKYLINYLKLELIELIISGNPQGLPEFSEMTWRQSYKINLVLKKSNLVYISF